MPFIKGPKQLISSAITNALNEYFIVDASLIESNLIKDAKIILHNLELRPKTTSLVANNTTGSSSTVATATGVVEEVEFSWAWTTGKTFIKDTKLTMKGLKFKAKLEHGPRSSKMDEEATDNEFSNLIPGEQDIADVETQNEIKKEGGIKTYMMKHVEMMIDALTLNVLDFEFTIEAPDANGGDGVTSIVIGGQSAVSLSFGRDEDPITKELGMDLRQTLTIEGFYAMILGGKDEFSVPLIESFSYGAQVIRVGKRFGSLTEGLRVTGESISLGLVVHAGSPQTQVLSQLSVMLLAAHGEDAAAHHTSSLSHEDISPQVILDKEEEAPSKDGLDPTTEPSTFNFSIASMALVTDQQRFELSSVAASYVADGSVCAVEADEFELTMSNSSSSEDGYVARVKGMRASKNPDLVVQIDTIETLEVPNTIRLLSAIQNTRLEFEGDTLKVKLESIECSRLDDDSSPSIAETEQAKPQINMKAPFPINMTIVQLGLRREDDIESRSQLTEMEVFLSPTNEGTDFAVMISEFGNKLAHVKSIVCCGRYPLTEKDVIENGKFAADEINVHGGYSASEWLDIFRLKEGPHSDSDIGPESKEDSQWFKKTENSKIESKQASGSSTWNIPNARVEALKIHISYDYSGAVGVKDAAFTVKPFVGKDKTTGRDLVRYYTAECLKQVPGFIPNAEVLGLNVVDMGTNTYGAFLGMATPFGAAGGVAIMTGVDAVKGAVAAGKKGRKADTADKASVSDFFRGIGYAAAESTKHGALRRGKQDGEKEDVVDWVVGASADTGHYVEKNKSRLGGAGGAGAGMMVGTMLGGPIGGIIGGVLGGATTQKTIEKIDKEVKHNRLTAGTEEAEKRSVS